METATELPTVSVIVPARNEEACLRACLDSLVAQSGVSFEIIVVDDHSTDRTREIALSFPNVTVVPADPLPEGWTGKNNAIVTGVRHTRGDWLLFTDSDTEHLPGSLTRALQEAKRHGVALLSYSPEQIATSFWEKTVMPVIFAELASAYRPDQVSDSNSAAAAANGQYILVTRAAYDSMGGHAAVASSLLEDVALARAVKQSGRKIFFRYGADAVRTRMYRNFSDLCEGWTKNLALLFPNPGFLASWRLLEFAVVASACALIAIAIVQGMWFYALLCLIPPAVTVMRISRANFSWGANVLALLGLPLFSYLLLRSKLQHGRGGVTWKDRKYPGNRRDESPAFPTQEKNGLPHTQG